jgi:plasmid maintenance system killer protein
MFCATRYMKLVQKISSLVMLSLAFQGCDCEESVNIAEVLSMEVTTNYKEDLSPMNFSEIWFRLSITDTIVGTRTVRISIGNKDNLQYAVFTGPCDDIAPPKNIYENKLEKVSVITDKKYNELVDNELTEIMTDVARRKDIRMLPSIHNEGHGSSNDGQYSINQSPGKLDTFQLIFTITATNGSQFADTLQNVIIKP